MTPATILKHDDAEASLPHQVDLPAEWGINLPNPIAFEVSLPKWCPVDQDSLVDLHWWASLTSHVSALLRLCAGEDKVVHRLEHANRDALGIVGDLYGVSLRAAISIAGYDAAGAHIERVAILQGENAKEEAELGAWTMALQVAFGLLCTRAAAKGLQDPITERLGKVYEWTSNAFVERMHNAGLSLVFIQLCTGTQTGTVEEKLAQWKEALAQAAEGAPEGVDGLAEALQDGPRFVEVVEDGPAVDPSNSNYFQKCPACATVVSGLSEPSVCPVCEERGGSIVPVMQPITEQHFKELCALYEATATPGIEQTMAAAEALRPAVRKALERRGLVEGPEGSEPTH